MPSIAPRLAAIAVAALTVDVTGDGHRDVLEQHGPQLVIRSESGVTSVRLPGRLDGAFRIAGARDGLLLVRAGTGSAGVLDAIYRLAGDRLDRVHVDGPFGDGLLTALAGSTYVDIDCGTGPGTVVQVEETPDAGVWHETLSMFTLQRARLVLARVVHRTVTSPRPRRCEIDRR